MNFSYTVLLIIVTCAVSFYAYENRTWFARLSFRPYDIKRNKGEMYRFLSHAFVHADFLHLLVNMYVLYMFGEGLEFKFRGLYGATGLYYYMLLYFGGALFGGLPAMARHRDNIMYTSVGASGATSALVFSFIALAPTASMSFVFVGGVYIPAVIMGLIILVAEYYMARRGNTNIAHDAHIYGALYGFGFTLLIDRENFWNFIEQIKHGF